MEALSPRQQQVFEYLKKFLEENGYPPTIREIAAHLAVSGTVAVVRHLEALEKKGWIRRQPGAFRSISLVAETGHRYATEEERIIAPGGPSGPALPILGTVRAGSPELPHEDIEGYLSLDQSIANSGGSFYLRIKGDSMKNAGMLPGDLALIRPQTAAENGDIVVALVDGEATVKRFFRDREQVRLQPENEALEPILIAAGSAELTIIGKVVSLFRGEM